ncbi:MAG: enoyl-CoA hydratase-related protein [Acidimicrobiales bacterium]
MTDPTTPAPSPDSLRATAYEVRGRTAVITLDRPHRGNAWTGRMHAEYRALIERAEQDPEVRVTVVTGAGWAFCVGGDAEALSGHAARGDYDDGLRGNEATPGYGYRPEFDHPLAFHYGLTKPVIAAINGPAAGIGLVLACFADLRFAAPGVKLTAAHGKLNMPAEYGLSWLLPRLIGLSPAMDILLTSRVVLTDEAARLHLVNQLHPADELIERTVAFADELAGTVSARSLTETRRQVYDDLHGDIGSSVDHSLALFSEMMAEPEFGEGVRALREKRRPNF